MPRTTLITGTGTIPTLAHREVGLAYVCRSGVCHAPVSSRDELERELRDALAF